MVLTVLFSKKIFEDEGSEAHISTYSIAAFNKIGVIPKKH
jgi:hypothetical protein